MITVGLLYRAKKHKSLLSVNIILPLFFPYVNPKIVVKAAHLNLKVVIVSAMVALPQILLPKDNTVHWLLWTFHIAASSATTDNSMGKERGMILTDC